MKGVPIWILFFVTYWVLIKSRFIFLPPILFYQSRSGKASLRGGITTTNKSREDTFATPRIMFTGLTDKNMEKVVFYKLSFLGFKSYVLYAQQSTLKERRYLDAWLGELIHIPISSAIVGSNSEPCLCFLRRSKSSVQWRIPIVILNLYIYPYQVLLLVVTQSPVSAFCYAQNRVCNGVYIWLYLTYT